MTQGRHTASRAALTTCTSVGFDTNRTQMGLYPASSGLNIRLVDNATIFIVLLANVGCKIVQAGANRLESESCEPGLNIRCLYRSFDPRR